MMPGFVLLCYLLLNTDVCESNLKIISTQYSLPT
jgi:hypothetical protein